MTNGIPITCPHCNTVTTVAQIQGDRCPKCGFEFKWFGPGEERTARDYVEALTGEKYLRELPDAQGYVVAHE